VKRGVPRGRQVGRRFGLYRGQGSGGVPRVIVRSVRDEAILVEVKGSEIASLHSQ